MNVWRVTLLARVVASSITSARAARERVTRRCHFASAARRLPQDYRRRCQCKQVMRVVIIVLLIYNNIIIEQIRRYYYLKLINIVVYSNHIAE